MIEVIAKKASARESGKALAYLDPAVMAKEGLCAGEIVKISFRHEKGREEFTLRLAPELPELRNKRTVKIDRFYCDDRIIGSTVFIERAGEEKFLNSILLYSSPYVPPGDPYRKKLESLIRAFRLPATKNSEFNFIFSGNSSFHAKVAEIHPSVGGVIGSHTVIAFGPEDEERRERWEAEANWIQIAEERISRQRRIEALQERGNQLIEERRQLSARVHKIRKQNAEFSFEDNERGKIKLKEQLAALSEQKEQLIEKVAELTKSVREQATSLSAQVITLKQRSSKTWEKLMADPQNEEIWDSICRSLEESSRGKDNGQSE